MIEVINLAVLGKREFGKARIVNTNGTFSLYQDSNEINKHSNFELNSLYKQKKLLEEMTEEIKLVGLEKSEIEKRLKFNTNSILWKFRFPRNTE